MSLSLDLRRARKEEKEGDGSGYAGCVERKYMSGVQEMSADGAAVWCNSRPDEDEVAIAALTGYV